MAQINQILQRSFLRLIRSYRYVSAVFKPCCRFYPSCSEYAEDAIQTHGCLKGCLLTLTRLLRCHPFCRGGVDPVPAKGDC